MSSPVNSRNLCIEHFDSYESSDEKSLDSEDKLDCAICFNQIYPINLPLQEKTTKKVKAIFIKKDGKHYLYINKCHHLFHQSCLLDWFEACKSRNQTPNCPSCREPVKKVQKPSCFATIFS